MRQMIKGYAYTILSAVIFGCSPLAAKYVYSAGLNPFMMTFYRNFLALPVFYTLMRASGEPVRLAQKARGRVLALAITDGVLTQTLLFSSYLWIPSGVATTFHFVYPTVVIVGSILLFRQRISIARVLGVVLCTAGVLTFYTPGQPLHGTGCALALLSGVTYAAYILLLEHCRPQGVSVFKISFYIAVMVSIVMAVLGFATQQFVIPTTATCWIVCAAYALFASVGGIVLFQKGTSLIGGQCAAVLSAFEPITSILVGIAAFHEPFTWHTAFGSGCVIIATVVLALSDIRKQKTTSG